MSEDDWSAVASASPDDDSQWVILHSRFQDPVDMLAAVDPDDPFIRLLLAQREQIRRQYEQIKASAPQGLTTRQRDEYVSARVVETIGSDVARVSTEPTEEEPSND